MGYTAGFIPSLNTAQPLVVEGIKACLLVSLTGQQFQLQWAAGKLQHVCCNSLAEQAGYLSGMVGNTKDDYKVAAK